jgi:hypothetical protein
MSLWINREATEWTWLSSGGDNELGAVVKDERLRGSDVDSKQL